MDGDTEKGEYGGFARFLGLFIVPVVFVTVLILVLLSMFGYDTKNNVLKVVDGIPFVGKLLPEAKTTAAPAGATAPAVNSDQTAAAGADSKKLEELNGQIAQLNDEMQKANDLIAQKDQEIKNLQAKNVELADQTSAKQLSDEEYLKQVKMTSATYAQMNASKSAPIMENLTFSERVLMLSQMKQDVQAKILEKMDPKVAAETSIALKDVVPVKDLEISALQERLKLNDTGAAGKTAAGVTAADLGKTFAGMAPKNAAATLMEMYRTNAKKVLDILGAADNQTRSSILSAIAVQSKETAAAIASKLSQ